MASPTALTIEPFEILRFHPKDAESQRFMHLLLELADQSKLDPHNRQFLRRTGRRIKVYHSPTGPDLLDEGYFSVGWHQTCLFGPHQFTFGSGRPTINGPTVDILLTPPQDQSGERIAGIHLVLELHPMSGAWTVQPLADVGVGCEEYVAGQLTCLSKAETTFTIRNLVYVAEFMVKTIDHERRYLEIRNRALQACGEDFDLLKMETRFSAIPFKSDPSLDIAIPHRGLGSGAHGTVFAAFDPKTGELRAVKRLEVKNIWAARAIEQEVGALKMFADQWGIVQTYGFRNRSGGSDISITYPEDFYIVMENGVSFKEIAFYSFNDNDPAIRWQWRAWLTMNLLVGLEAVHLRDAMHRDINWRNILYFHGGNGSRPRAVLADFGKFIPAASSREENIGNRHFLPPEIKTGEGKTYTQLIDVWMLAYALIQTFWPKVRELNLPPYIGPNWHNMMEELHASEPHGQPPKNILWAMFMPFPEKRATATEAIKRSEFRYYFTDDDWDFINSRRYRGGSSAGTS